MGLAIEVACQNTVCGVYGRRHTVSLPAAGPGLAFRPAIICTECQFLAHELRMVREADPVEVLAETEEDRIPVDLVSQVPDGTAVVVLDWAGRDPDRLQAALAKEQAKANPRSTLIRDLERTLAAVGG
jgi:hypothetical protein